MIFIDIDSGYFYAGVTVYIPRGDTRPFVSKAAPIVKYMIGWDTARVLRYVQQKGWSCTVFKQDEGAETTLEGHKVAG